MLQQQRMIMTPMLQQAMGYWTAADGKLGTGSDHTEILRYAEMLAEEENFGSLARINRALIGKAEALDSPQRVVLDMDSTEVPVYGQQENSAYNGHFESTCYHPLLLFNSVGDCLAAKLRPGNVSTVATSGSATQWRT